MEEDQKGNAHAMEEQVARELALRKDCVTVILVQVCYYVCVWSTICFQLRPPGQHGDPGQAAQRPVEVEDLTGTAPVVELPMGLLMGLLMGLPMGLLMQVPMHLLDDAQAA